MITVSHRLIQADFQFLLAGALQSYKDINLAAGNGILNAGLDCLLSKEIQAGNAHIAVEITVVDGTKFHSDVIAIYSLFAAAITGHAFDQSRSHSFVFDHFM